VAGRRLYPVATDPLERPCRPDSDAGVGTRVVCVCQLS
jgi:hypothetical protein